MLFFIVFYIETNQRKILDFVFVEFAIKNKQNNFKINKEKQQKKKTLKQTKETLRKKERQKK